MNHFYIPNYLWVRGRAVYQDCSKYFVSLYRWPQAKSNTKIRKRRSSITTTLLYHLKVYSKIKMFSFKFSYLWNKMEIKPIVTCRCILQSRKYHKEKTMIKMILLKKEMTVNRMDHASKSDKTQHEMWIGR